MAFSSAFFLFAFFPAAFVLYRLVPGMKAKNAVLAVLSLAFYCFGSAAQLPLLLASVLVSYIAGRILGALEKERGNARRAVVITAAVLHIGLLAVYKYLDFFLGSVNGLFGTTVTLPGLALPLGISFFTFTGLGYVIETYRKPANADRNFIRVLLFIALFPNLLAGPILRWRETAPQLWERTCTPEKTLKGLGRFILGLSKKLLIADIVGGLADAAFASASAPDARLAWLGAAAYAVQIYFDFSGCSDMAIGIAGTFGFDIPENFKRPYTALGMTDFWQRWHISLTTWFRNYLYMPIVMSKGQKKRYKSWAGRFGREKANKLAILLPSAVVWLLTGLWHGAAWTFVLWGLWHGLFCVLEGLSVIRTAGLKKTAGGRILLRVYTAAVVLAGCVLFRAGTLAGTGRMLAAMVTGFRFTADGTFALQTCATPLRLCALAAGILLSMVTPPERWKLPERWRFPMSCVLCAVLLVLCVMSMAGSGFQPFIYQQF